MLEDYLAELAKKALLENIMEDFGVYMMMGMITLIFYVCYRITNAIDERIDAMVMARKIRKAKKGR